MSEVIFVGQPQNEQGKGFTGNEFSIFHQSLEGIESEDIDFMLERRLAHVSMVVAYSFPDTFATKHEKITAAAELMIVSYAQADHDISTGVLSHTTANNGWPSIARASLRTACAHSDGIKDVDESIFFVGKNRHLSWLSDMTFASLEPAGAYTRQAFTAGIAMGGIWPNPQHLPKR